MSPEKESAPLLFLASTLIWLLHSYTITNCSSTSHPPPPSRVPISPALSDLLENAENDKWTKRKPDCRTVRSPGIGEICLPGGLKKMQSSCSWPALRIIPNRYKILCLEIIFSNVINVKIMLISFNCFSEYMSLTLMRFHAKSSFLIYLYRHLLCTCKINSFIYSSNWRTFTFKDVLRKPL